MGSMCDPYMPLEKELKHVQKALELIITPIAYHFNIN